MGALRSSYGRLRTQWDPDHPHTPDQALTPVGSFEYGHEVKHLGHPFGREKAGQEHVCVGKEELLLRP